MADATYVGVAHHAQEDVAVNREATTRDRDAALKALHWAALILSVIGAINWGLVGLLDVDLVATIFGGEDAAASRVIYTVVGIAGLVLLGTTLAWQRGMLGHPDAYRRT
jgi:uncharacterized membrane protein YuzA (DUF378 family)